MRKGTPFEEWSLGQKFTTRGRTVSETDIVNYVNTVGYTASLFLDMEYLAEKGHSRRMAPAMLTGAIADALIIQTGMLHDYAVALLGIEGFTAHAPVYADDTLHVEVEVTEVRPSKSKPDRGVVRSHQKVINQMDRVVLEYDVSRMLLRGDAG